MRSRLKQMLTKEFIQVFRNPRTRYVLIVPPMVQLMVFGYAVNFDIRQVPTAVYDLDHSQESRELMSRFEATPYFRVAYTIDRREEIAELIDHRRVTVAIQILPGFAQSLRRNESAAVQVIVDGTDSNTALIAMGYASQIIQRYSEERMADRLARINPALGVRLPRVELEHRAWYNQDLESRFFFVPGVIANLIWIMVTLLTSFAVVRERELGTLEQIMVTPIRPLEFLLGKTIPFALIGLADAALITVVGTLWFRIPLVGSLWVLFLGVVLFLMSALGVGLYISTVSQTQQQAMVSAFLINMPAIILSGFAFPIANMPQIFQKITYLNPLRYFLVIIRGVFLKGSGLNLLWDQMVVLGAIGLVLLLGSAARFHKRLA